MAFAVNMCDMGFILKENWQIWHKYVKKVRKILYFVSKSVFLPRNIYESS